LNNVLTVIIYILAVLVAIIFLVVTHELGHYTAARLAGVKCPEFFVGFGPRIWSTRRGDTEFGIKWILFGGYVKVLGMNPEEEISPEDFPHSYKGVSYWKRFWIIFSGSLVHLMLGLILIFLIVWMIGVPFASNSIQEVALTMENTDEPTPAAIAGLEPGDTILSMDGQEVSDWQEISSFIREHPGEEVEILITRGDEQLTLTTTLADRGDETGYLGISPQDEFEGYSFFESFKETGIFFWENIKGVGVSISKLFNLSLYKQLLGISEPTQERTVSVVGISRIAGQAAKLGAYYFLGLLAFILIFIALINLLPLPPLDGGHLAVLLWEKITGREVDMRKLYPIAIVVMAFFLFVFASSLILDFTNPINLP
jgi:membrane-associated protease RseP (regulator of RpoE activity)